MHVDFRTLLQLNDQRFYFPVDAGDPFTVLPQEIVIALTSKGEPILGLELFHSTLPSNPPFAIFNLAVTLFYDIETSLQTLRQHYPKAQITPASFINGYLRFFSLSSLITIPDELQAPRSVGYTGLNSAYFVVQLSETSAGWLVNALESQVLDIQAFAELEIEGVAPRIPATVRFDPAELIAYFHPFTQNNTLLYHELRTALTPLPDCLKIETTSNETATLVDAFADRVYARLMALTPASIDTLQATARLLPIESGSFIWNLMDRVTVRRPLTFQFNPLIQVRMLFEQYGIENFVKRTILPFISSEVRRIHVRVTLPENTANVRVYGVRLRTFPNPPRRPAEETRQAEFTPDQLTKSLDFRLLPDEKLHIRVSTYIVVDTPQGTKMLNGVEYDTTNELLTLYPQDFPVRFITVSAAESLTAIADIHAVYRSTGGDHIGFKLNKFMPNATLAILLDNPEGGELSFQVVAHDGSGILNLEGLPLCPVILTPYSFLEYGVQTITVTCRFEGKSRYAAFEFEPQAQDSQTLTFYKDRDENKSFRFVPVSPFAARYRYRHRGGVWSDYQPAAQPLTLIVND